MNLSPPMLSYNEAIQTLAFTAYSRRTSWISRALGHFYQYRIFEYPLGTWKDFFLQLPTNEINTILQFMKDTELDLSGKPIKREAARTVSPHTHLSPYFELERISPSDLSRYHCISHSDSVGISNYVSSVSTIKQCSILTSPISLAIYTQNISLEEAAINSPELFFDCQHVCPVYTYSGKTVVLLNQFGPNYFHTLIETSARLHIISSVFGYDHFFRFLVDKSSSLWHLKLLESILLPFKNKQIVQVGYGQYNHSGDILITPTRQPIIFSAQYGKRYIDDIYDLTVENTSACRGAKADIVYIRRRDYGIRSLTNQHQLEELVRKCGGRILDTEEITLEEQWQACKYAKVMIGVHGAGLANMVFMQKNAQVIELSNRHWKSDLYPVMALSLGLRHEFLCCNPVLGQEKNAHLYIDEIGFKRLREILNA